MRSLAWFVLVEVGPALWNNWAALELARVDLEVCAGTDTSLLTKRSRSNIATRGIRDEVRREVLLVAIYADWASCFYLKS